MAVEVGRSMLRSLPYDATVHQSLSYLIHFLAMSLEDTALPLAQERQPALLAALRTGAPLHAPPGEATTGIAALYQDGLALSRLEQYTGHAQAAAAALRTLENALAQAPPQKIDQPAEIARAREQYALLGAALPPIRILPYIPPGSPRARINPSYGSATVLLLFPAWCAQCRKMMPAVGQFLARNGAEQMHVYGLLALDPDQTASDPFTRPEFHDLLHTPTLVTPSATLQAFAARSFPLAVITDGRGRIRFLGPVPTNALDGNGFIEQFIDRSILKTPATEAKPTP